MEHNPDIGAPPPVWTRLRFEARAAAADEPTMASYLDAAILSHDSICRALAFHIAEKLAGPEMGAQQVRQVVANSYDADPTLVEAAEADMQATLERDPACRGMLQPFLFFIKKKKGKRKTKKRKKEKKEKNDKQKNCRKTKGESKKNKGRHK